VLRSKNDLSTGTTLPLPFEPNYW